MRRAVLIVVLALISAACTTSATEPVEVSEPAAVLTGRQAIEAAQGTAHILWFWGAN